MKSGTNPEEKVENGSDFASMLTKYKKKAAQDDETKRAETGETKKKETQQEETKSVVSYYGTKQKEVGMWGKR